MLAAPLIAQIDAFRDLIARHLGLHFDDSKTELLAQVLRDRMRETGCDAFAAYLHRFLEGPVCLQELAALAEILTVNETSFFRYSEQFNVFTELAVPQSIAARRDQRQLRILSAGCSSGEEAYSLAILLAENFPELAAWDVEILAVDINASMIARAVKGQYSNWSLRDTPPELRSKYFRATGSDHTLVHSVRPAVKFETRNLLDESTAFWQREKFDIVFCRNVTMYFTPKIARALIARIAHSLVGGGFLFLGHAESLRDFSCDYQVCESHGTFYYRRHELAEGDDASSALGNNAQTPKVLEHARPWFDVIRQATANVTRITGGKLGSAAFRSAASMATHPAGTALAPVPSHGTALRLAIPPAAPHCDRAVALELLRAERFQQALELLQALPPDSGADADTQLLLAILLANGADAPRAEAICRQILELDEINAGAYYVMALCREQAGDREIAMEHDQAAAYLDPGFAMPHLHLGLLAKRSADWQTSRRELANAQRLLKTEDTARILLFGGGFKREALLEMCRVELSMCGGRA